MKLKYIHRKTVFKEQLREEAELNDRIVMSLSKINLSNNE